MEEYKTEISSYLSSYLNVELTYLYEGKIIFCSKWFLVIFPSYFKFYLFLALYNLLTFRNKDLGGLILLCYLTCFLCYLSLFLTCFETEYFIICRWLFNEVSVLKKINIWEVGQEKKVLTQLLLSLKLHSLWVQQLLLCTYPQREQVS